VRTGASNLSWFTLSCVLLAAEIIWTGSLAG
jgi:hypothetical protein